MNRLKESNVFSGGGVIPLNNRRTLLKSYIWNYVVSNSGKATLENSIKGDIDLELIGNSVQPTTTGKNLFDPKQLQGISGFTIEGNEITQSGYNVSTGKTLKQLCPEITPGTYILSANNGEFTGLFGVTKPMYKKSAIEIVEEDLNRIVSLVGNPNKTIKYTLQIEKGNTVTPYEPYTGLKPSPSPEYPQEIKSVGKWNEEKQKYEIDVKVTGKNLFPYSNDFSNWKKGVNNSYFGSVTSDESGITLEALKPYSKMVSPTFKLKPNTEYTISAMIDTKDKSMSLGVRIFKNLNVSDYLKQIVFARRKSTNNPQKVSATFITDDLKDTNEVYLQLDCSWGDSVLPTIVTFYDIQLELGNNATNYEPYTEQTLTLTSDRPITKWDKLVEQGGSMGWLYSGKIAKEFTFVSKASDENISGRIRRRFKTSLNGKFPQTDKVMCNFLTTDNVRNDYSIGIVGSGDIYIYFYENTGVETLEQANHWLKNLPFEKTIIFERKTTEFVPLSESEQTQLRNLHSYNGTTNITVDSGEVPCGIKVAYKQKK